MCTCVYLCVFVCEGRKGKACSPVGADHTLETSACIVLKGCHTFGAHYHIKAGYKCAHTTYMHIHSWSPTNKTNPKFITNPNYLNLSHAIHHGILWKKSGIPGAHFPPFHEFNLRPDINKETCLELVTETGLSVEQLLPSYLSSQYHTPLKNKHEISLVVLGQVERQPHRSSGDSLGLP